MGRVHCRDKRTGIVYVYESHSYWDKAEKKTKAVRKLIGKLDENGNVVPTSGHPGRPRKHPLPPVRNEEERSALAVLEARLQSQIDSLTRANSELSKEVREEKRKRQELVSGLESLVNRFKEE